MAELKKLLTELIRGRGSVEQAHAALGRYLAESPQQAPLVAKLLKAARDAGLPHHMYVSLSASVPGGAGAARDPDATLLATDDDVQEAEKTLLVRDGDVSAPGRRRPPPDDKTEVLPGGPGAAPEQTAGPINGRDWRAEPTDMSAADPDKTSATLDPGPDAATRVNPSLADKTLALESDGGFDILSSEAMAAAGAAASVAGAGITREFREGDHLRNRFQLLTKLGEGGMGAVWKGKDLLKEEARDRNPYVAIKLLQGDFKEHPEAFIALQRETAKQQRLAHPNIATVYDFDRDDSTNTVFMTMEVLEGQPLDAFIRKLPAGGLPAEEAIALIEQLCNGLAYAHSHELVHSDLKPGNCFLTREGNIKLLDFGIARASKTKADAEGETTLFDPGQLGALTPTYATVEMFEGDHPDPRDDIYALAIMAYQLLTGKHPYGKKSAPKARELGLRPDSVAKLNKRQNKGLLGGLAFRREDRIASVEDFLDSIRPRKSRTPMLAGAGLAATLVIGALAYGPVVDLMNKYEREKIIMEIERPGMDNVRLGLEQASSLGDPAQLSQILNDPRTRNAVVGLIAAGNEENIHETLALMQPYDPNWQRDVKEAAPAKAAIMDLYQTKINEAFNINQGRYDYATADARVTRLDELYPDSAKVLQIRTQLNQDRATKLADLSEIYTRYLEEGRLLPRVDGEDIGDVVKVVRQIDPAHPLLNDDRLRFRYGELAEQAIDEKAYARADALLNASLDYAPDDAKLNDLRFRVQAELQRITNERRVAEIERRLEPMLTSLNSLARFEEIRDDLVVLADLSPDSSLLRQIQSKLKKVFTTQLDRSISRRSWADGERVLVDFSKLFDIPYLTSQRQRLSKAENQAGFNISMTPELSAAVDDRVRAINALLSEPEFSSDWEIRLKVPYKELIAMLPQGDLTFARVRNQTARLYLEKARSALQAERFVEALAFVDRGRVFYPGLRNFDDFEQAIAGAQEDWRKRRETEQRLARIDALRNEFNAATERNDVKSAQEKLAGIKAEGVPAGDPFLSQDAPFRLANAYLRLAKGRIEGERPDYEQALMLTRKGLEFAPDLQPLKVAAMSYEIEVNKRQLEIALRKLFDGTGEIDVAATETSLGKLETDFPDRFAALRQEFAESRGNRIRALANSRTLKISTLDRRMDEYAALFPDQAPAVKADVAAIVEKRIKAARLTSARELEALSRPLSEFRVFSPEGYASLSGDLTAALAGRIRSMEKSDKFAAAALLDASVKQFGAAPFQGIDIELPLKEIADGMKQIAAGRLNAARSSLAAARARNPGHGDLPQFEQALETAMTRARSEYQKYASAAESSRNTRDQSRFDNHFAGIQKLWSDNPEFRRIQVRPPRRGECGEDLAGYGKRRGGECWDLLGRAKGPLLVVVPAGGSIARPFAISKYEISGKNYNDYCQATGACKPLPRSKARLPLTSVSVGQAEAYARWLSEQASLSEKGRVVYRLPTEAEWEHAAKAAGGQPEKKYNCRVTVGGNVISGHALIDAASGAQNGWGLANYIGNAQEWVQTGSGLRARGGAFPDPLTRCDISNSRNHSGQADNLTGFRLVRELG